MYGNKIMIQLFNHVDILVDGESIFLEKQLTSKLKSLLEYFMMNRGSLCRPEKIIEDLWPENDYIDEKKVLQTYVHRLRNMLYRDNRYKRDFSDNISILSNKGYYLLQLSDQVYVDTDIFQQQVKKLSAEMAYEELLESERRLADIYCGHYLQNCKHEGLVTRQRNFHLHTYLSAMGIILNRLYAMGKYHDIIHICERFFLIDDVDETINILFLNALIESQQAGYALRHYKYIEQKLNDILGIRPSEDLEKIYKKLRQPETSQIKDSIVDKNYIKNVVYEIIEEKLKVNNNELSFLVKLKFGLENGNAIPGILIEKVLLQTLRKNDMFTIVDAYSAVAILNDIKEEYLTRIKDRMQDQLLEELPGQEVYTEISVWPVSKVM